MSESTRWHEYADMIREMIPDMDDAKVFVLIEDGKSDEDIIRATQLGYMLMTGKPLVLLVMPGQTVPAGLRRAADAVLDDFVTRAPESQARMTAVLKELRVRFPENPGGKYHRSR